MRKQIRHRSPSDSADAEDELAAWPALVDVLAAAFVFMLIAFIGTQVREFGLNARLAATAAEEGRLIAAQVACARERAAHDVSMEVWKGGVDAAAAEATRTYVAAIGDSLRAAGVAESAAEVFVGDCAVKNLTDDGNVNPGDRPSRVELMLVCAVPSGGRFDSDSLMYFQVGGAVPMYAPGLLPGLRDVIRKALDSSCTAKAPPGLEHGCTAGFEVAGHADCTGTDEGRRYWELSTNRAGAVIGDLMTGALVEQAKADMQFAIQASGYETRVAANPECSCDRNDWRGQTDCLANNRRIELRFRIRTRVLPAAPRRPECKEAHP